MGSMPGHGPILSGELVDLALRTVTERSQADPMHDPYFWYDNLAETVSNAPGEEARELVDFLAAPPGASYINLETDPDLAAGLTEYVGEWVAKRPDEIVPLLLPLLQNDRVRSFVLAGLPTDDFMDHRVHRPGALPLLETLIAYIGSMTDLEKENVSFALRLMAEEHAVDTRSLIEQVRDSVADDNIARSAVEQDLLAVNDVLAQSSDEQQPLN